jgi:hypothetical protein
MSRLKWTRVGFFLAGAMALALPPGAAAVDGGAAAPRGSTTETSSYYEGLVGSDSDAQVGSAAVMEGAAVEGAAAGLPSALHVVEGAGGVAYRPLAAGRVEVRLELAERPHERVDAVYDLVLALALPVGAAPDWRIVAREGTERASVPLVYGGEKVMLKRNRSLEKAWLPVLVGAAAGLPDLAGTGYAWTLWDTILRYDPAAGATLQGFATLGYEADPGVGAPDPEDPRHGAYLITWIPSLDPSVPPFTVRLDAIPAPEE